jgi:HD superfamily phosphodiesterase
MYETIRNDEYIINIYNEIEKIQQQELWIDHSWYHINKVISTSEYILNKLNCTKEIIDCGKIAALLHDIGIVCGKEGHAEKSYEMVKKYFENKNIDEKNKNIILEIIRNHGGRNDADNLMELVLMFADKTNFDKDRMLSLGKTIEGQREMDNIEKVDIDLNDKALTVNFIINECFNKEEFEKFLRQLII